MPGTPMYASVRLYIGACTTNPTGTLRLSTYVRGRIRTQIIILVRNLGTGEQQGMVFHLLKEIPVLPSIIKLSVLILIVRSLRYITTSGVQHCLYDSESLQLGDDS